MVIEISVQPYSVEKELLLHCDLLPYSLSSARVCTCYLQSVCREVARSNHIMLATLEDETQNTSTIIDRYPIIS